MGFNSTKDYVNHSCVMAALQVKPQPSVYNTEPEQVTDLVKAYRYYSISEDQKLNLLEMRMETKTVLTGAYGRDWPNKDMFYRCDRSPSRDTLFECFQNYHSCGIYAYKHKENMRGETVVAEVLMGGQVVEHTEGYLASYCVMVSLEFNTRHSTQLCEHYANQGVAVICKGGHIEADTEKLSTQHLYFGSWVREHYAALHNPRHVPIVGDIDVAILPENFWDSVEYFSKSNRHEAYGDEGDNRASWGPVQLAHGVGSVVGLPSHNHDIAVVRDYDEFIAAYTAHLDITANALMMRDGKLVETIPGAEADVRNRIVRPVDEASAFRPDRLKKIRAMLSRGWTLAEGVELPVKPQMPISKDGSEPWGTMYGMPVYSSNAKGWAAPYISNAVLSWKGIPLTPGFTQQYPPTNPASFFAKMRDMLRAKKSR